MSLLKPFRSLLGTQLRQRRYARTYRRFREFTMIDFSAYAENLRLAEEVQQIAGCVVECGVWRGGMSAGLATVFGPSRDYFLFDSFEGLPPARAIDGKRALEWQSNIQSPIYYNNCAAPLEFAERAMSLAGAPSAHLIKGWFSETLAEFKPPSPIVLLRLDADWYDSTIVCLESLFDYVALGGLIILDDYYQWDGCSRALHDFLSRRSAVERIRGAGAVCYLYRAATEAEGPSAGTSIEH